jgi:hypothetical protein
MYESPLKLPKAQTINKFKILANHPILQTAMDHRPWSRIVKNSQIAKKIWTITNNPRTFA